MYSGYVNRKYDNTDTYLLTWKYGHVASHYAEDF